MADAAPDPLAALLAALAKDARAFNVPSLAALAAFLEARPALLEPRELAPPPAPAPRDPEADARLRLLILPRIVPIAKPAGGSEFTVTVPTNATWYVLSVVAQLVTSATVANRSPELDYSDGTTIYMRAAPGVQQAASLTVNYAWVKDFGAVSPATGRGAVNAPLGRVPALAGHTISSLTASIAGGGTPDQWQSAAAYVLELRLLAPEEIDSARQAAEDAYTSWPGIEQFVG